MLIVHDCLYWFLLGLNLFQSLHPTLEGILLIFFLSFFLFLLIQFLWGLILNRPFFFSNAISTKILSSWVMQWFHWKFGFLKIPNVWVHPSSPHPYKLSSTSWWPNNYIITIPVSWGGNKWHWCFGISITYTACPLFLGDFHNCSSLTILFVVSTPK